MSWLIDEDGRECAYTGKESCGHSFKPWSEFYEGKGARGYESWCKACRIAQRRNQPEEVRQRRIASVVEYHRTTGAEGHKRAKLKHLYGITPEQYAKMLAEQGGVCFLCGREETRRSQAGELTRLIPDHDHACGQGHPPTRACPSCIRGLLCHGCNSKVVPVAEQSARMRLRFEDYLDRRPLMVVDLRQALEVIPD